MLPVGFLLQFDTKVLRYESVFIIIIIWIKLFSIHLSFKAGYLSPYGIDLILHSGIAPKQKLWSRAIPLMSHGPF